MNRRQFFLTTGAAGVSFAAGATSGIIAGAASQKNYREIGKFASKSYAQQGEDLILWNIFNTYLKTEKPSYLEIGTWHPIQMNNTYLFYEKGCRGVLVEPNPDCWPLLQEMRPGDQLIKGGIGISEEREADYFMIGGNGSPMNTFSRDEAESYSVKSGGKFYIDKVIKMPLVNINDVISKYFSGTPNLVSIDVEGLDLGILQSLDFGRHRPEVFCIETLAFGTMKTRSEIAEFMAAKDYVVRGGTFVNSVFVDRHRLI